MDSLIIDGNKISFALTKYKVSFHGNFIADSNKIRGVWEQDKFSSPFTFYRPEEIGRTNRPQYPFKPYSYNSDSVVFFNSDSIKLAGTLTYPANSEDKYPAIVLINGLGPHDRDESMYGHKPFLVISDFLTKNGFAVLRVDDRGVGESNGDFNAATTKDFSEDILAAVNFLKTKTIIDTNKIGLIGFNEGGLVASLVVQKVNNIEFIVLLSTPGITGKEILINQTVNLQQKAGVPEEEFRRDLKINKQMLNVVETIDDTAVVKKELTKLYKKFRKTLPKEDILRTKYSVKTFKKQLEFMTNPWFKYYLTFNPRTSFEKVKCPVLVLYGEHDLQVDPKINMVAIEEALKKGGNKNVKGMILPKLNHLFQNCETGLPNEYSKIEETFSVETLNIILKWINNLHNDK